MGRILFLIRGLFVPDESEAADVLYSDGSSLQYSDGTSVKYSS